MDKHGFSGVDAWVARDRESGGGAQRRKIARRDMAVNSSVTDWLAHTYPTQPSLEACMLDSLDAFFYHPLRYSELHHAGKRCICVCLQTLPSLSSFVSVRGLGKPCSDIISRHSTAMFLLFQIRPLVYCPSKPS